MKKYILLSVLTIFMSSLSFSQTESNLHVKKNLIYVTPGWLVLYGNANISYERTLRYKESAFLTYINWNITYGRFAAWEVSGPIYKTGLTGLTGKKNRHFELHLGAVVMFDHLGYDIGVSNANYPYPGYSEEPSKLDYSKLYPSASVGYRYQKPDGRFVFRTGFGWHEALYFSFGYAF